MLPELKGIDHVHVYVADREKAASWYETILGFRTTSSLAFWADDDQGPLTIEDASGKIHLALFGRADFNPTTAIAFKVSGVEFLKWKSHLEAQRVPLRCADHDVAWSLYFSDPDENVHEITTYDYTYVANKLDNSASV